MTKFDTTRLIAWIVSVAAVIGSLYFSEVKGFIPCELCWYQRILMYPLIIVLGVGFYKKDRNVIFYSLPLSVIGIAVSFIHYLHQKTPLFNKVIQCTAGVPCSGQYINLLGFITIPFLALVAFILITALIIYSSKEADRAAD